MTAAMAVTLARRRFRIGLSLEHDLFWLRLAFPWDRKSAPRPTGSGRGAVSLTPPEVVNKPDPAPRDGWRRRIAHHSESVHGAPLYSQGALRGAGWWSGEA